MELLSRLQHVFRGLLAAQVDQNEQFYLAKNLLGDEEAKTPVELYRAILERLDSEKPEVAKQLQSCLKTLEICINCGQ